MSITILIYKQGRVNSCVKFTCQLSYTAPCQLRCILSARLHHVFGCDLSVDCQLQCDLSAEPFRLCGQFQSAWVKLVSSAVHTKCQLVHDLSAWLPSVSLSAHCELILSLPASQVYVQQQWNELSSNLSVQLQLSSSAQLPTSTRLHTCKPAASQPLLLRWWLAVVQELGQVIGSCQSQYV